MVGVAASIVAAQCQANGDPIDSAVVQEAVSYLSTTPQTTHWLWGRWDAPYVATHGPMGEFNPPPSFESSLPQGDHCWTVISDAGLTIIATGGVNVAMSSEATFTLTGAAIDTYDGR